MGSVMSIQDLGKGIPTCVPLRLLIIKFHPALPIFSGSSQSGLGTANFMTTLLLPREDLRGKEVHLRSSFPAHSR